MKLFNLIRGGKYRASEKARFQVLCKPATIKPFGLVESPSLPPALHPALMERLLGKSPLRLVAERTLITKGLWREKLECGHTVDAFLDFLWSANSELIEFEPTAKRRRCQKCKPAVAPVLKTKTEITADQARVALIKQRKLQFGSLFDKLCFANGELRPGQSAKELMEALCATPADSIAAPSMVSPAVDAMTAPILPVGTTKNTTNRLTITTKMTTTKRSSADSLPPPRKPVQSEKKIQKRKTA